MRQIFRQPQHPYTQLLMESLPSLDERGDVAGRRAARRRRRRTGPRAACFIRAAPTSWTAACTSSPCLSRGGARAVGGLPSARCQAAMSGPTCVVHPRGRPSRNGAMRMASERGRPMTPLLEADDVTKVFGSGVGQAHRDGCPARFLLYASTRADRRSPAWWARAAAARAPWRGCCWDWRRRRRAWCATAARICSAWAERRLREFRQDVQAVFQDPFESFNSFYRVDHMLKMPIRKFKLAELQGRGPRADREGVRRGGAAAGGDAGALSRTS